MSFADKVEHKAEELKGAAKEKFGDATDNERLQAEGAAEQQGGAGGAGLEWRRWGGHDRLCHGIREQGAAPAGPHPGG